MPSFIFYNLLGRSAKRGGETQPGDGRKSIEGTAIHHHHQAEDRAEQTDSGAGTMLLC